MAFPLKPGRRARASGALLALAVTCLSGCGDETAGSTTAQFEGRAERLGVAVELIYVIDLDGYRRAVGAMGVYGDDAFQDIYVSGKGEVRLTVERRTLTAADCPSLPIPGAQSSGGPVRCTADGDGWRRSGGDRQEYAAPHGDHLVRVSGRVDATTFEQLRKAARNARPASAEQLDEMLPPDGGGGGGETPPPRGDLPPHGDGAPNNEVGPGG